MLKALFSVFLVMDVAWHGGGVSDHHTIIIQEMTCSFFQKDQKSTTTNRGILIN